MEGIGLFVGGILALAAGVALFVQSHALRRDIERREQGTGRRMYELAILKELGDRIGYSLNVEQIIDIITGSLHQFIDYSVVSYMLLEPERVIFKAHLERSVHRKFIDEVRVRMLQSLSALLNREFEKNEVAEVLSGAILIEDVEEPVRSFFNIPLVIGEKVVGVLTVAHTASGLYKEEEMTILYKITQQASNAVTRLQEVVKTEQGKLNAMVESMAEGVVMTDKDYRIAVVNPAAKQIVGLVKKEELTIFDFIDNLAGSFDIRGRLEESVKLDKVLEARDVLIRDRFFQIFVSPVKANFGIRTGEILGGVVIFHDITHEKEIERLREDFTSMMVHELRSPLGGIARVAELLLKRKETIGMEKIFKEYLPLIYQNSSDMLGLVNDLLDAAKIEAGKFQIMPEPASLKKVVEERVTFFKTSAESADITLNARVAPDVPESASFDAARVGQVLNNLISNALKFSKAGARVTVHVFSHAAGKEIYAEGEVAGLRWPAKRRMQQVSALPSAMVVAVADTGAGIAPAHVDRLFNKFMQFRATATSGEKGTGLGLVIAKGIVEAHGGTVGVESEEGIGSVFYFTLPSLPPVIPAQAGI